MAFWLVMSRRSSEISSGNGNGNRHGGAIS
jgi:hypothetical protein